MVSSNDTIIVKIANSIVSKINSLIGNHNSSNTAHSDIRNSIPTTTNQLTNNSGFLTSQDISGKANTADLATVATTGSYNDLEDSPEIPKVFYGTSLTSPLQPIKKVTTSSNYTLSEGTILIVYFDKSQSSLSIQLKVNNEDAIDVICDDNIDSQYRWKSKEVVSFVYDGTNFVMMDSGKATTTYYGVTKLSSSVTSTSITMSATPSAVKQAYDLANTHTHGNINNTGALSETINNIVDTNGSSSDNNPDLLLFADASDNYKIKGSNFIDTLNDIIVDLINEGEE